MIVNKGGGYKIILKTIQGVKIIGKDDRDGRNKS